ncbi:MAG: hypothetical protein HY763_01260 [Planctomycetes bacterium]|nr:hypothetical protein [Planctomycetota bacterium]
MTLRTRLASALVGIVLAGCHAPGGARPSAGPPPLFEGMGSHTRRITTSSPEAQRYFNQGLTFTYAFNHDEAIRSFGEAARLDPNCAMAWWGIALCNGPHINNPAMPPERSKAAWGALAKAQSLLGHESPVEQGLIRALARRYADPPPADRKPLDEAYAAAMREVWQTNRNDADVAALFAEAMMDLRPWDLWTHEGRPQPGTEEIVATLEEALRQSPNHPGALHLYIHAVEASPRPDRAMDEADRLRDLVPAAGHLVHMPSHIDVRTGRWAQAADANVKAVDADRRYRRIVPRHGFYHVYMAHNHHFLAYAAMMEGRGALALDAARETIAGVPAEFLRRDAAMVDGVMPIAMEVLMRFGRWDEILRESRPRAGLPISRAFWHFIRGVARAAKGQVTQAEREQADFRKAVQRVPEGALMAINPAHKVLRIADHLLEGEIAFRRGDIDHAVSELRHAIEIEDGLQYMEPPDWIQPVRHTLGAFLVSTGRMSEAEEVYREDLKRWPENGWSLFGLWQCVKARGDSAEAGQLEQRFRKAWARADVNIASSCLCVAGAEPADAGRETGTIQR